MGPRPKDQAGELRYTTTNAVTIVDADMDGDKIADLQIELTGSHNLMANDFTL